MYYELSREQKKLRQQLQARDQELIELEARAGIAEEAEKLRKAPASLFPAALDKEMYSDAWHEAMKEEELTEKAHVRFTDRRLRKLYFTVQDADLRKTLMAKQREIGGLNGHFWQEELADAARRPKAAQRAGRWWWALASFWGAGYVGARILAGIL
jgi:hypothetical protein